MRYGVPYQGSKNKICDWLIERLPSGDVFVDLFAGGCAVTHAALLSGKYNRIIVNDIGDAPEFFRNAVAGKYANEKRWISREDFRALKDKDPYISLCWSFGNNRSNYLYAEEVEPWKKALHYARVFGDKSLLRDMGIESDGSSADVRNHHDEYKDKYIKWWLSRQKYTPAELEELIANVNSDIKRDEEELRQYLIDALKKSGLTQAEVQRRLGTQMAGHYFGRSQWEFPTQEMYEKMQTFLPLETDYNELVGLCRLRQSLQRLQRLQSLQRLQRLQSLQSLQSLQRLQSLQSLQNLQNLQSLQRLEVSQKDFSEVEIPEGAVVYADPPYRETDQKGYGATTFDHERFDEWLGRVPFMVIISEYTAPRGCVEVASIKKQNLFSVTNRSGNNTERLFVQERFLKKYNELMSEGKLF